MARLRFYPLLEKNYLIFESINITTICGFSYSKKNERFYHFQFKQKCRSLYIGKENVFSSSRK